MRAHLLQLDLVWEDRAANCRLVEQTLDGVDVNEGDLIVLPELFDSGFSLNVDRTRDAGGETLRFLLELADDLGVVIHGSRTVRDCDCTHATNQATVVGPGERLLCDYAKIHPFTFGREGEAFVGGDAVTTYDWGGLNVCPAVCYDLRFPELFRLGLKHGAEAFVLGANWPDARMHHWRALAIARAIENHAYVLAVNRTGPDPHLNYVGGTIAVGPTGEVLGELSAEPGVLSVEVDPGAVRSWRETFPAWRDMKLI
ncbi:MAG: nitrilase-related carbon-nitrogen hydrolase [Planctomycetota bacterium]